MMSYGATAAQEASQDQEITDATRTIQATIFADVTEKFYSITAAEMAGNRVDARNAWHSNLTYKYYSAHYFQNSPKDQLQVAMLDKLTVPKPLRQLKSYNYRDQPVQVLDHVHHSWASCRQANGRTTSNNSGTTGQENPNWKMWDNFMCSKSRSWKKARTMTTLTKKKKKKKTRPVGWNFFNASKFLYEIATNVVAAIF